MRAASNNRVTEPDPTAVTDVVVVERRTEADRVVVVELERPCGGPLPRWSPGAHVDLLLPDGLVRQYSLCGDPARTERWRLGVLREELSRGGSAWVHDQLTEGTAVQVRGPRNNFALFDSERYRFVAGGIGITPLLPMVREAAARGKEWTLHYGARSRSEMAFRDELAAYGAAVVLHPQDEVGLLDMPAVVGAEGDGALVYACGPAPLLEAVERHCGSWPSGRLHIERFTAVERDPGGPDAPIEVVCAASDLTVVVPPGTTVLDALEEAGLPVFSSCTEGICGTCETSVIDGEPDHRDSLLTDEERAAGDTMMICVSRARSRQLVLDI